MRVFHLLALLALLPAAAGAQQAADPGQVSAGAYVGKRIVDVQLLTEGQPTRDPAVMGLLATKVGDALSMAAVRETLSHLFSFGRYQDVQVDASHAEGGVILKYNFIPVHNVTRVEFSGSLGVPESKLREAVSNRFGPTPPIGRVPDVALTLDAFYRERGFLHPAIDWHPTTEHDPDRTVLAFTIDAGTRARIGTVDIEGETLVGRAAFLRQANAGAGEAYNPLEIRKGLEKYVQDMRKRGRYEATATYAAREPQANTVDLTFDVQAGPAVTVRVEGDPLPSDRVKELVPVEREGSVDEDLIEDSAQRITAYLAQQGYWKASVTSERRSSNGTLSVVFTVNKGPQYRIAEAGPQVTGNRSVPIDRIRPLMDRLEPGGLFLEDNLSSAVNAIAGIYLRLGFASVKITPATNEVGRAPAGYGWVQPVIAIAEGPKTEVGTIAFEGNTALAARELTQEISLAPGAPYFAPDVKAARDAVLLAYLNLGYSTAKVDVVPAFSADGTRVDLRFDIIEGPQTIVDHIIITGNTKTDPRVIYNELLFREGGPLGLEAVMRSQQRLGELGLFRRIRITELTHMEAGRRDVLVAVEEAARTTMSYGGGAEVARVLRATGPGGEAEEHLELAPRGFFDVGRRNIAGKNRSVNLFTRLSLRPRDVPEDPEKDGTGYGFSEYRVVASYREPKAFGTNADFTFTGALEQGVRASFNFARRGVIADLARRLAPGVRVSGRYSFNTTRTFDERLSEQEQATIDRIFPQVRLSGFAGGISRDTRDDLLEPTRGTFTAIDGSFAARSLGGQVGFAKTYIQGSWFHQVPRTRRVVFAGRLAVGLANGFPREVEVVDEAGNVTVGVVDDLPASERFFAGGDTSIRGFALDTVGAENTISDTGFPRGGNAVLIMNGELRFPVWNDLGAAVFVDGGNVFARVPEFSFAELRGSAGFGLRYRSPVGPIRIDVGFKMDRRVVGGTLEPRRVIHFSIGQVF